MITIYLRKTRVGRHKGIEESEAFVRKMLQPPRSDVERVGSWCDVYDSRKRRSMRIEVREVARGK